ncbi:molybdopterin-binding protein [Gordonibacter sp.]|uniref:molybdopterin-binding protein n=1 Tax=Gordonibacter sp. TaxID=1968902 RepID=UPI002FCA12FB
MIAPQEIEIGKTLVFEGYADDFANSIVAMQFSLDDGETWATHDVSDTTADLWVHWTFSYAPQQAGTYRLKVRSINEAGRVSPLSAVVDFVAR